MQVSDLIKEKMYCDTISQYIGIILTLNQQVCDKEKAEVEKIDTKVGGTD